MGNLYEVISGIFSKATGTLTTGIYEGASGVFNNAFYETILTLSIISLGFAIAFRRIESEELAHKFIWTLAMLILSKMLIFNKVYYEYLVEIINIPRDVFIELINGLIDSVNSEAKIEKIISNLELALYSISSTLFAQGNWNNLLPYLYGAVCWITGTFLILVTLINTVFALFLSDIVIAIAPFVIPTLAWKKTEYVFFSWIKLYVSLSLYAPFTLAFGVVTVYIAEYTQLVAISVGEDVEKNVMLIIGLVVTQCLCALAIFKIPNIINQLIGSANEGSSMTAGIGTISAGATVMAGVSKFTGMSFMGKSMGKGAKGAYEHTNDKLKKPRVDMDV